MIANFSAWLLVRFGQPSPFWVGETAAKICRIPTASGLAFFAEFFFSHCSFGKSWFMKGFPGGASGKEAACQCRRPKRLGFDPWVGKSPLSRKRQCTPAFLPRKFHAQGNLAGYTVHGMQRTRHDWSNLACTARFNQNPRSSVRKETGFNLRRHSVIDTFDFRDTAVSPCRRPGSVPGSGRSPGAGNGIPVCLPGESQGQREPGGLQSMGSQESGTTERLSTHTDTEACGLPHLGTCELRAAEGYSWPKREGAMHGSAQTPSCTSLTWDTGHLVPRLIRVEAKVNVTLAF